MPDSKTQSPFFKRVIATPSLPFLLEMVATAKKKITIISPWISYSVLKEVLDAANQDANIEWRVLSRGKSKDFQDGISDIHAFKLMVEKDSFDLRSIKNLHAKIYIIDGAISLVTSANLTDSGMKINPEMGIASTNPDDLEQLTQTVDKWFSKGRVLGRKWLESEQQKLLEYKKNKPQDITEAEKDGAKESRLGEYRNLHLPTDWIPLLDSLKEKENPTYSDHLSLEKLLSAFEMFFTSLEILDGGEQIRQDLIDWLIHGKTFAEIGYGHGTTRENVSRKIGNRKNKSENIWNSDIGVFLIEQVAVFINAEMQNSQIKISNILTSDEKQVYELSMLDISRFVSGMISQKILPQTYQAKIISEKQFVIYEKDTFDLLRKIEDVFCKKYYKFIEVEAFCKIGEIDKVVELWFSKDIGVLNRLYITQKGKVGCRKWNLPKKIAALAWELADEYELYYWHYSHMENALKYLDPEGHKTTTLSYVNNQISETKTIFQFAGTQGYWQLLVFGDGYQRNEDAVAGILRETGHPLHYIEIIKELEKRKRFIENPDSIYQLLIREEETFGRAGRGMFTLKSGNDVTK